MTTARRHFCTADLNPTGCYCPCSIEAKWAVDGFPRCGTHKNKDLRNKAAAKVDPIKEGAE